MSTVNIAEINKVDLLHALWKNARPAAFFFMNSVTPPKFNDAGAAKAVEKYIDYYDGRCIKCDLSKDEVNPWGYDRDWGQGAFQRIVDQLREKKPLEMIVI